MMWLVLVPLAVVGVYRLRAVTHAPTPDRRPGELPDVSREPLRERMRAATAAQTPANTERAA